MELGIFIGLAWNLLLILSWETIADARDEVQVLLEIKAALDPHGQVLHSWEKGKSPCNGDFLGISCNDAGDIANLSLQGRGLSGSIPAVVAELASLTGLYLHYNSLKGQIPGTALARLKGLTEVYLNVNNLSGTIPPELGSISTLQVLQLCCNGLSGRIPEEIGQLSQLHILGLDHNSLTDNIPVSFGGLLSLTHLGLSFNKLSGPIPSSLCNLNVLTALDVLIRFYSRSSYKGSMLIIPQTIIVLSGLHRLQEGFTYANNPLLCGDDFFDMIACGTSHPLQRPQPFGALAPALSVPYQSSAHGVPKPPQVNRQLKHTSKITEIAVIGGVIAMTFGVVIAIILSFVWFRRHKPRISSTYEGADYGANTLPEISFECGMPKWDKSSAKKAIP
ncbi:hypothetical protein O6H91_14G013300 [Diphasiastrum complanatum]|uniref:Uncharacterized protein n=1 Tax=Diphasiastrum complanatum TaxID=34168 RepID=A0ACC2BLR3_DIPCM|nr:hypothetical protein O6H91_14G013300 [Diphasiastrum complanatum]